MSASKDTVICAIAVLHYGDVLCLSYSHDTFLRRVDRLTLSRQGCVTFGSGLRSFRLHQRRPGS